jgi:hypothetical protein
MDWFKFNRRMGYIRTGRCFLSWAFYINASLLSKKRIENATKQNVPGSCVAIHLDRTSAVTP